VLHKTDQTIVTTAAKVIFKKRGNLPRSVDPRSPSPPGLVNRVQFPAQRGIAQMEECQKRCNLNYGTKKPNKEN
jgi:hypothetical protein